MSTNGRRVAVRVAWKAALAARAGTALTLTLIGLPVAALVATGLPETDSGGVSWGGFPESLLEAALVLLPDSLFVLLVSLLAAPAFALDGPRLRRLSTLISGAGGGGKALRPRTVVLVSGPLLGAVAGLLGTVAGFGLAFLAGAPLTAVRSWDVPGFAIALAVISGSAAARLAVGRGGWWYRVRLALGGFLVAVGAPALSLGFLLLPDTDSAVLAAMTGMWSLLIGFALLVPAVVALAGRFAGRLPQPLCQAVQDAARHRGRTAPGVIAAFLVAAVFATVATGATSDLESERLTYDQWLPVGNTMVYGMSAETAPEVLAVVEREFPGVPMTQIDEFHERQEEQDGRWFDYIGTGGRCDDDSCDSGPWESIDFVVADPETVRLLVGDQPEVVSALAAGKVVTYLPDVVHSDGTARFKSSRISAAEQQPVVERTFSFPAVYATSSIDRVPDVIFPRQVAIGAGLKIEPGMLLTDTPFSEEQLERLDDVVAEVTGSEVRAYTEPGFDDSAALSLWVPGAVTSVLVLVAALIAAWRAAAGAGPRVRRRVAAPQAGFIALLGCGLGLLAGIPLGLVVAALLPRLSPIPGERLVIAFDVPWLPLLGGGVAVSLLATRLMAVLIRRTDDPHGKLPKDDRPHTHQG